MKRRKFTKTNIEKIPHPENGKREAKYFDFNKKKFNIVYDIHYVGIYN